MLGRPRPRTHLVVTRRPSRSAAETKGGRRPSGVESGLDREVGPRRRPGRRARGGCGAGVRGGEFGGREGSPGGMGRGVRGGAGGPRCAGRGVRGGEGGPRGAGRGGCSEGVRGRGSGREGGPRGCGAGSSGRGVRGVRGGELGAGRGPEGGAGRGERPGDAGRGRGGRPGRERGGEGHGGRKVRRGCGAGSTRGGCVRSGRGVPGRVQGGVGRGRHRSRGSDPVGRGTRGAPLGQGRWSGEVKGGPGVRVGPRAASKTLEVPLARRPRRHVLRTLRAPPKTRTSAADACRFPAHFAQRSQLGRSKVPPAVYVRCSRSGVPHAGARPGPQDAHGGDAASGVTARAPDLPTRREEGTRALREAVTRV